MNKSKVAVVVSRLVGMAQLMAGSFLVVVFGISTIIYLANPSFRWIGKGFFIFCLVVDFIGMILILASRRTKKLIEEFKKCVSVISVENNGNIEELALTIGKPEKRMKKDIELMIKRNYFANAYINHETNTLVIGSASNVDVSEAINKEYVECVCKNCGAKINVLKGRSSACDYCGTPLRG